MAHNCHGNTKYLTVKPKVSRQYQIPHGKTKMLTAKPNSPRQNQNAHGETIKLTAKPKTHGETKKLTAKQLKNAHGKTKKPLESRPTNKLLRQKLRLKIGRDFKGFIKGEAFRILRTNSPEATFEDNISNFKKRLIDRGYPGTNSDRKPSIRYLVHREGECTPLINMATRRKKQSCLS